MLPTAARELGKYCRSLPLADVLERLPIPGANNGELNRQFHQHVQLTVCSSTVSITIIQTTGLIAFANPKTELRNNQSQLNHPLMWPHCSVEISEAMVEFAPLHPVRRVSIVAFALAQLDSRRTI